MELIKRKTFNKMEPNSLPKKSKYLKIPRNKLIFSGFSRHFGFYSLKSCSKRILRDRQAKLSLFGVFVPNQVSKRGPHPSIPSTGMEGGGRAVGTRFHAGLLIVNCVN